MSVKIGFIGSSAASSPHHESFRAFIPKEISFNFVQETGVKTSLYDARGKVDALIAQANELIRENDWDGIIISGAPKEALNPGMWQRAVEQIKKARGARAAIFGCRPESVRVKKDPVDDAGG